MQRRVEHAVRLLLPGENPGFLAPAHAGPHGQGFLRHGAAELVIAHNAPQQPHVGGADAVVVVQVDAGQGADEHAMDHRLGQALAEERVQPVDALNDDDVLQPQTQPVARLLAFAPHKAEPGHLHFVSRQQLPQLAAQQRHVEGVDALQVHRAVRLPGQGVPVKVVVVQAHLHRAPSQHPQMDAKPARKGGFPAGGRPRHQHNPLTPGHNLVGNGGNGLVMQRLVDADEGAHLMPGHQVVQVGGVEHAQNLAPSGRLAEHLQVLGPVHIGGGGIGLFRSGHQQHKAARVGMQGKHAHIARGGRHGPVEILPHAAAAVHAEEGEGPVSQERHLVLLAVRGEIRYRLLLLPGFLLKGQIRKGNLPHRLLRLRHLLRCKRRAGQADKYAMPHGILNAHLAPRLGAAQGQQHHKAQRALIDAPSLIIPQGQGFQRAVARHRVAKLHHLPAALRGQHMPRITARLRHAQGHGASPGNADFPAVHSHLHHTSPRSDTHFHHGIVS